MIIDLSTAKRAVDFLSVKLRIAVDSLLMVSMSIGMLFLSWRKWPDALVDFGRELYIPWQLNCGKVLYRDIFHFSGPVSPYLNAWVMKLFGPHLLTIALFNSVLVIILAYLIYRFFFLTTSRLTAVITAVVFLGLFAFSQYTYSGNYNFISPYSSELVHGILLFFLCANIFITYLECRRSILVLVMGVLTGLVFLTKIEVFIPAFAAMSAGLVFLQRLHPLPARSALKQSVVFFLGVCAPILVALWYFSLFMPLGEAVSSLTVAYRAVLEARIFSMDYFQNTLGVDSPLPNIIMLLSVALWYIFIIMCAGLMEHVAHYYIRDKRMKIIYRCLLVGAVAACMPYIVTRLHWFEAFRILPVAMIILGVHCVMALRRGRDDSAVVMRLLPILVMTVYGFLLLLKIVFDVHIFHIGFALSLPATLLLFMSLIYQLPRYVEKLLGGSFFIRVAGLFFAVAVLLFHISVSRFIYGSKTYTVGSGPDAIIDFGPPISVCGQYVDRTLKEIETTMGKDETFVVLPDGVMLNYLSRRPSPIPYVSVLPLDVDLVGEKKILSSLIKARPDYCILIHKDLSRFGYPNFGTGYGVTIYTWVTKQYIPIWNIGDISPAGKGYEIIILKRTADYAQ